MSLITIDESACKKDGMCAAECPVRIITRPTKTAFPAMTADGEERCIDCGHCVAVCPHGALDHARVPLARCAPLNDDRRVAPEAAEQFLRGRRSTRAYRPEPLDRETLARLVDTARHAPSGHNSQLVEWIVIHDTAVVKEYAGLTVDWMRFMVKEHPTVMADFHLDRIIAAWEDGQDLVCRSAPHVIMAHGPTANPIMRDSGTIAVAYLELAAHGLGLGACWAGFLNAAAQLWPPLKTALGFPEGHGAFGALLVGTPRYTYHRIPERRAARIIWR